MPELERMLTQLGRELEYPPTPELAATVLAALREPAPSEPAAAAAESPAPRPARPRRPWALPPTRLRRPLALALAALLLLAGAAVAAVPGVRDAVLEFLGLQGATVERRERLPAVPELRPLELGERVSLAAAPGSLAFDPLVPSDPGRPDAVYIRRVPGGELSLAYRPRPGLPRSATTRLGLLVSEFRGDLLPEYAGKIAPEASTIKSLRVDGERAIWIEGAPHLFFYRAPGSGFRELPLRLAQNVLLLERGELLVRLEGAFGRERALEIARSLR